MCSGLFSLDAANIFTVLLAGVFADRLGVRRATLFYSFLIAVGAILFCIGLDPLSQSYYLLLAGRFIFGKTCPVFNLTEIALVQNLLMVNCLSPVDQG